MGFCTFGLAIRRRIARIEPSDQPGDLAPERSGAGSLGGQSGGRTPGPRREMLQFRRPSTFVPNVLGRNGTLTKRPVSKFPRHLSNTHKARPGETDSCPRETDSRAGPNVRPSAKQQRRRKRHPAPRNRHGRGEAGRTKSGATFRPALVRRVPLFRFAPRLLRFPPRRVSRASARYTADRPNFARQIASQGS